MAVADPETGKELGVAENTPVLKIERIATSSSKQIIEWRISFCVLPNGLNLGGVN